MCANLISIFLRSRRDCWKALWRDNVLSHVFVDIARDFASVCGRTPRRELASGAIIHGTRGDDPRH